MRPLVQQRAGGAGRRRQEDLDVAPAGGVQADAGLHVLHVVDALTRGHREGEHHLTVRRHQSAGWEEREHDRLVNDLVSDSQTRAKHTKCSFQAGGPD